MAKYYHGVIGPISGKVGSKVYTSRNGQGYVQSMPKCSTKPATTKQIIQRTKFGLINRFISPLRNILNLTYSKINRKRKGVEVAVRQIHADAIIGAYPDLAIDFSKVTLTRGHLSSPNLEMIYSEELAGFKLSWQSTRDFNAFPDDELIALIYCTELAEQWIIIESGIYRDFEQGLICIPARLSNREVHIWLFYRSIFLKSYSHCTYMGNFFISNIQNHEIV